jgi:phosphoribosylamine-glycine ligase
MQGLQPLQTNAKGSPNRFFEAIKAFAIQEMCMVVVGPEDPLVK